MRLFSCRSSWMFAVMTVALTAFMSAAPLNAQSTDAFAGLGGNTSDPIEIEAGAAEIRQADNRAILSGGVVVRQGDAVLKTAVVYVDYVGGAEAGANQDIHRIEAPGKVAVSVRDQTASGDRGIFNYSDETLVVSGNVVLSQGPNVMRGERLVVNLRSGKARMEGQRPVQILIQPRSLNP